MHSEPGTESDGPLRAIVIGSSGGIGAALVRTLEARDVSVTGLSRSADASGKRIDLEDETSIAAAAERCRDHAPYSLVVVATGFLHDDQTFPERALRDLDGDRLARSFRVNAIGPALVAKHFAPLLPREGRSVFAALSARVGSIGDNRIGGWYGYRASKAALNMLMKTAAIEIRRTRPQAICVTLHPGTVDTKLSKPFQRGVPDDRLFTAEKSARHLLDVLDRVGPADSGKCFAWDGQEVVP